MSRKTATRRALRSTRGTIAPISTETAGSGANSSDLANTLSYEQRVETPSLFGENSSMIADSKALTAPHSETKAESYRPSLSDRLTPLLISAGLVKGTTHTSIRKELGAAIRASALWPLDGGDAEKLKV